MNRAQIDHTDEGFGLLGNIRAEMGRARVTSSLLARTYGGAVSYWTRRINGEIALSVSDVEMIAAACEVHPATLFGGVAPSGWKPAAFIRQYDPFGRCDLPRIRPPTLQAA
jgi:hypothetical protein